MSDARVLLVTGGSRGIGAAVCRKAALQGWQVMINYVANEAAAQAVADEIAAGGGVARIVQGDTGTEEGVDAIFAAVDREFGRLDGLFNNAGVVDRKARLETFWSGCSTSMLSVRSAVPVKRSSGCPWHMAAAAG